MLSLYTYTTQPYRKDTFRLREPDQHPKPQADRVAFERGIPRTVVHVDGQHVLRRAPVAFRTS